MHCRSPSRAQTKRSIIKHISHASTDQIMTRWLFLAGLFLYLRLRCRQDTLSGIKPSSIAVSNTWWRLTHSREYSTSPTQNNNSSNNNNSGRGGRVEKSIDVISVKKIMAPRFVCAAMYMSFNRQEIMIESNRWYLQVASCRSLSLTYILQTG